MSFQTLENEIASIVKSLSGYHNIDRWFVDYESVDYDIVNTHEYCHDQMLTQTCFGTTQYFFTRLQQYTSNTELSDLLDLWLITLMDGSKKTHEVGATYLSIKMNPVDQIEDIISIHPPDYQEYYHTLADIIDPVFHSTYLQYLVGLITIKACFSSNLQSRLLSWNPEMSPELLLDETPNYRLNIICNYLTSSRLENLLEVVTNSINQNLDLHIPASFSIQSEVDWTSLKVIDANSIDDACSSIIHDWFFKTFTPLMSYIHPEEWVSTRNILLHRLEEMCNVNLHIKDNDLTNELKPSHIRARRFGLSSIINKECIDVSTVKRLKNIEIDDMINTEGQKIIISHDSYFDDVRKLRYVFYVINDDDYNLGTLSYFQFKKKILKLNSLGIPAFNGDILIGASPNNNAFPRVSQDILRSIQSMDKPSHFNNLFWYMGGDFFQWADFIISNGKTEVLPIFHTDYEDLNNIEEFQSLINTQEPITINQSINYSKYFHGIHGIIFRNEVFLGPFIRWFQKEAMFNVMSVINDYLEQGLLTDIHPAHKEVIGDKVIGLFPAIETTWYQF